MSAVRSTTTEPYVTTLDAYAEMTEDELRSHLRIKGSTADVFGGAVETERGYLFVGLAPGADSEWYVFISVPGAEKDVVQRAMPQATLIAARDRAVSTIRAALEIGRAAGHDTDTHRWTPKGWKP